jgi:hypothetical protein
LIFGVTVVGPRRFLAAEATELDRDPLPIGVLDPLLFRPPRFVREEFLEQEKQFWGSNVMINDRRIYDSYIRISVTREERGRAGELIKTDSLAASSFLSPLSTWSHSNIRKNMILIYMISY